MSTAPLLSGPALQAAILRARDELACALADPLPLPALLASVERFAQRLQDDDHDLPLDAAQRRQLLSYCDTGLLQQKVDRELGEDPFCLRRINYREPRFEAWRPLGCVLHVMPSNAPLLPFLATLESLLVGNVNWVRLSGGDTLSQTLLQALVACDDSGRLAHQIVSWQLAREDVMHLLPHVDGVSAWGGDAALDSLRRALRPGCRWIPWGHKISFMYLTPAALAMAAAEDASETLFDGMADAVCCHDQQACSSPQLLLVDCDDSASLRQVGQHLAAAMARRTGAWPALQPDLHQAADISATLYLAGLQRAFQGEDGALWQGEGWAVLWQHQGGMAASPLYRTLLLRPLPRARLVQALLGWRGYLQTCGVACAPAELPGLAADLIHAGVGRLATPGTMHDGYIGEPHDNVRALAQLARRVSVSTGPALVAGRATLESRPAGSPLSIADDAPVMDKQAFLQSVSAAQARLYFRSGGSSGVPTLSAYSYRDYHLQMRATADGLYAAGLDPLHDRVLNLLGAGNLYGGLLSSFLVLDKMDAVHFPMGLTGAENHHDIAALIAEQKIDTLIGLPSSIYQLFWRAEHVLRDYGGVRKIFLGGEHISLAQRQFLAGFGVTLIRSAIYGSNDAGPLGHACAQGEDGSFHLLADLQQMEIFHEHEDRPVAPGQPGRLLFTSRQRQAQHVVRYEIGDLGQAIAGECACGLPTPRFRLLGRHGQYLRLGIALVDLVRLAEQLDMPVQFVAEVRDGTDHLLVLLDGDLSLGRQRLQAQPQLAGVIAAGQVGLTLQ